MAKRNRDVEQVEQVEQDVSSMTWNEIQDILPKEYITSVTVVSDDTIAINNVPYILTNITPLEAVRKIQNYIIGQKKHG